MKLKHREIIGILLVILGILILLSLVSYNSVEEPTISKNVVIDNWMGILGVYISHFFIKEFMGIGSFIFPVLLILWGIWVFLGNDYKKIISISFATIFSGFLLSILISLPVVIKPQLFDNDFQYSGLAAGIMTKFLYDFIGLPGTIIIVVGLLLIIFRLYFSVSYSDIIKRIPLYFKREKILNLDNNKRVRNNKKDNETDNHNMINDVLDKIIPNQQKKKPVKEIIVESPKKIFKKKKIGKFNIPPTTFLTKAPISGTSVTRAELERKSEILERELDTFKVQGKVMNVAPGPMITTFEVEPAAGIRVNKISNLADDLARVLEAIRVRIVAPIPGTSVVGIEIPNDSMDTIYIKGIIESSTYKKAKSPLTLALGKTSTGEYYTVDLRKMPHLLVAGATGSGKSVAVNMMIASILYKAKPDEVKFVMIDPKKLELAAYKKLIGYHLITCGNLDEYIVTEPESAVIILKSVVLEMELRYDLLAASSVRNLEEYNERIESGKINADKLPYIVVVIDELADLMMTSAKEVEEPIARLAQKARAIGIHLIVATQRPSVDVITGVIKANFPARMAFQTTSKIDSRTILDFNGAEKLLGRGDMLLTTPQNPEPKRLHSAYISLEELDNILDHITTQPKCDNEKLPKVIVEEERTDYDDFNPDDKDALYDDAIRVIVNHQQGSVSLLQRRLRVGYARAGRLIDQLERDGIVGPHTGSKARDVLVDEDYLDLMYGDVNNID